MRGAKGIKNIIFGIGAQLITIALGIVIPRLVLVNLGSEANGLLSSIGTVLTYLSLLEAGVGTATVNALYKPVALEDKQAINSIMSATAYFYRRTGYVYLGLVLLLSFGYALLLKSGIPQWQVFLVVLMAGLSGVINYFFHAKLRLLLTAEGKDYVSTNISTLTTVFVSLSKAAALLLGGNVVVIQAIYLLFNFVQMLAFLWYFNKHYQWLNLKETPDFSAISQSKAVLIHQISGLIFSYTDVLLLTIFTSLKTVSVYSMYAMVYGMVKSVSIMFTDSFAYELGHSFHDSERFMRQYNAYEVMNLSVSFALFCIAKVLMVPFMRLYTAGVVDINYIDEKVAWLFVIYYLLHNARQPSRKVIDIAQKFEATKWRSVLESVINLTVSLSLTAKFGIYGVLCGTIVALLYRSNDMIIYSSKLLQRSVWVSYRRWFINIAVFTLVIFVTSQFHFSLDNYGKMFLYGIGLSCTVIPLFVGVSFLFEREAAGYIITVLGNILRSRLGK